MRYSTTPGGTAPVGKAAGAKRHEFAATIKMDGKSAKQTDRDAQGQQGHDGQTNPE